MEGSEPPAKKLKLFMCNGAAVPSSEVPGGYERLSQANDSLAGIEAASVVAVHTATELETATVLKQGVLLCWVYVVALGLSIVPAAAITPQFSIHQSREVIRHRASMRAIKKHLHCTERFARKHRHVVRVLKDVASREGSKWIVSTDIARSSHPAKHEKTAHASLQLSPLSIDSLSDVQAFLKNVRRLTQARGDQGTYARSWNM